MLISCGRSVTDADVKALQKEYNIFFPEVQANFLWLKKAGDKNRFQNIGIRFATHR